MPIMHLSSLFNVFTDRKSKHGFKEIDRQHHDVAHVGVCP